ncbi:MAG TPA: hypothetical protein PKE16_08330, partial [Hyphomicrobium sp.]|nr:hypothetical protein [Hyphomicrobium sp.]
IEKISHEIGFSPMAARRNTTKDREAETGWKTLQLSELSEADRVELRARTQLDRYLWRRWVLRENVAFAREEQSRFRRSEFVRPRYQCERRLARMFG